MTSVKTTTRLAELIGHRSPFVHATVVRAQEPTSARPGDEAIVHPDGSFEGFVGGQCAAGSVRTAAMDVLRSGEGVLLRVLPEGAEEFPDVPGSRVVVNPCLSGGALEIFLEPVLPAPILHIVGAGPVARSLAELAEPLGFSVALAEDDQGPQDAFASIISSHGGDEQQAIRDALDAGVPFIGLVASHKRGPALVAEMDLDDDERARVHTPVGLPIGAETKAEIALSVLAEVVQSYRGEPPASEATSVVPHPLRGRAALDIVTAEQTIDPVCQMTVTIGPDTPHAVVDGEDVWFCRTGCRDQYVAEHAPA